MKLKYIAVIFCLLISSRAWGQSKEKGNLANLDNGNSPEYFCNSVLKLLSEATINFERIRGKVIETNNSGTFWTAKGGISDAITSDIINTNMARWQYEGVVYLGNSFDSMIVAYNKYRMQMENCLSAKGYIFNTEKNSIPKIENYPDVIYEKPGRQSKQDIAIKQDLIGVTAYVTLKVEYSDVTDTYTLTINVWNN